MRLEPQMRACVRYTGDFMATKLNGMVSLLAVGCLLILIIIIGAFFMRHPHP